MSSDKSQSKTLLIDADLYLYRAAVGAEEEIDWGDDIWSLSTDLKVAKESFENQLTMFREQLETEETILCFSDTQNFRKKLTRNTRATGRKQESRLDTLEPSHMGQGQVPTHSEAGARG